ncbi:MAG: tetratricopeptide repeat protein [Nitrospinaceae bacterium]
METSEPDRTENGISAKIKIGVILLTLLTLIAFAAFFLKLSGYIAPPSKQETKEVDQWGPQLLAVGDRLQNVGLLEQAIDQYTKFLDGDGIDLKTRARVSHQVGELFLELGNCREALSWLFQAEAAGPDPSRKEILNSHIDICLQRVSPAAQ